MCCDLVTWEGGAYKHTAHADATHCGANHTVGLETAFSILSRRRLFVLLPREWHCKATLMPSPLFDLSFILFPVIVYELLFQFVISLRARWAGAELKTSKGSFLKRFNFLPPLLLYISTPPPFFFVFHPSLLCQEWTCVIKPLTCR